MALFEIPKLSRQEKKEFQTYFNLRSLPLLRFTLMIIIAASIFYFYLDYISAPIHYRIIWALRLIATIVVIATLIATFNKKFIIQNFQTTANIANITYNIAIVLMIYFSSPEEKSYFTYYTGLIIIWMTTIAMRIRLVPFLLNAAIITVLYLYIAIVKQNMTSQENIPIFINNLFFMLTTILSVSIADLVLESFIRRNFLDQKILKLQNAELEQKNEEISVQSQILQEQKKQLENKHRQVMEGINYARYIQKAVLPSEKLLDQVLKNYFLIYLPKQIVSGDFYYVKAIGQYRIVAVGDCTGHGVPGGFLVMLSISLLDNIIIENPNITNTADILEKLRKYIKRAMGETKDGLDIALCVIDDQNKKLYFSGAFNPVIIARDGQITDLKAVKAPIAVYPKELPFQTITFDLEKGDIIYLFSDGLPTQRNKDNIPYGKKRLWEKILIYSSLSLKDQYHIFLKEIAQWTENSKQLDDITILALKI